MRFLHLHLPVVIIYGAVSVRTVTREQREWLATRHVRDWLAVGCSSVVSGVVCYAALAGYITGIHAEEKEQQPLVLGNCTHDTFGDSGQLMTSIECGALGECVRRYCASAPHRLHYTHVDGQCDTGWHLRKCRRELGLYPLSELSMLVDVAVHALRRFCQLSTAAGLPDGM